MAAVLFMSASMFGQEVKQTAKAKPAQSAKPAQQVAASNTNPNAPIIKFDKLVHDYGEIQQHADGRCEFKFTNKGKEPLILSNVRSSCGCTVPEWPRKPIMPGHSDVVKVKYDTKRVGPINKSIHVYSNATESTITLRIKGKIDAAGTTTMPEKKIEGTVSPSIKK